MKLKTLLLVALLCAPLAAQEHLKVGELAPELNVTYWLDSVPEMTTLAEMRGSVVLIKAWGID